MLNKEIVDNRLRVSLERAYASIANSVAPTRRVAIRYRRKKLIVEFKIERER